MIDNCITYLKKKSKEDALHVYITDALKAIADNTGRMVKEGVIMSKRFAELLVDDETETEQDSNQKAEEIKSRIKSRLKVLGERRTASGSSGTSSTTDA